MNIDLFLIDFLENILIGCHLVDSEISNEQWGKIYIKVLPWNK